MGQAAGRARPRRSGIGTAGEAARLAEVPAAVLRQLDAPLAASHGDKGTRASEIVGFAVSDAAGQPAWTTPCGGTLRFWYLVEAREPVDDLNVGIHFYDRRGVLVFAVGNANRGLALPSLAAGERVLCAVSVTLDVQPGQYTLLPQVGGLTGEIPDPGVLHDRLESLPPIVVTRRGSGPLPPFYGLVDLPTEFEWIRTGR
jgi:hypothetical protein